MSQTIPFSLEALNRLRGKLFIGAKNDTSGHSAVLVWRREGGTLLLQATQVTLFEQQGDGPWSGDTAYVSAAAETADLDEQMGGAHAAPISQPFAKEKGAPNTPAHDITVQLANGSLLHLIAADCHLVIATTH